MISLDEQLMPIREVPAWLAERGVMPHGKPVTMRTVQNWIRRGRLEATPRDMFGVRYTSVEALERMLKKGQAEYLRVQEWRKKLEEQANQKRPRKRRAASKDDDVASYLDSVGW